MALASVSVPLRRKRLGEVEWKLSTMLAVACRRATGHNIPFDLDIDYLRAHFSTLTLCPMLNIPLLWANRGIHQHGSPTIDKIIPQMGYVKGNVQIISHLANRMKNDASLVELEVFAMSALELARVHTARIAQFYANADPSILDPSILDPSILDPSVLGVLRQYAGS